MGQGADLTPKNEISKFMIRTSSPCHWEKDETSGKTMRQNQLAVDRVSEAELRGHVQEKTDLTVSCMHRFPAKPHCVAEPELGVFLRASLLCPSGQGEPVAWLQPQLVSLQQVGAWSVVSQTHAWSCGCPSSWPQRSPASPPRGGSVGLAVLEGA